MVRPRETDKRLSLARRAVEVLEKRGLGTTFVQLARELGVNRTTLLYHFPNHEAIIRAVLGELLVEQASFVTERMGEHSHPIDRLYARVRAVWEFHHGRERRLVFVSQAVALMAGEAVTEVLKETATFFEADRRALVDDLTRGIEEGTVAPCDPPALVALARAVIDGLTLQSVTSDVDAGAVHELFWRSVLMPLRREAPAKPTRGRKKMNGGQR